MVAHDVMFFSLSRFVVISSFEIFCSILDAWPLVNQLC